MAELQQDIEKLLNQPGSSILDNTQTCKQVNGKAPNPSRQSKKMPAPTTQEDANLKFHIF